MRQVTLTVPNEDYGLFGENLKAWERSTGNDSRWMIGNFADPMSTTNRSSPVTLTCELDDTFFEQFPEWEKYVTR